MYNFLFFVFRAVTKSAPALVLVIVKAAPEGGFSRLLKELAEEYELPSFVTINKTKLVFGLLLLAYHFRDEEITGTRTARHGTASLLQKNSLHTILF